jgi:hypothetical protein
MTADPRRAAVWDFGVLLFETLGLRFRVVKRVSWVLAAVVVLGVATVGIVGHIRRAHRDDRARTPAAVHLPLETDAALIEEDRRAGQRWHFALVPQELPPGLVRMEAIGDPSDVGVTDVYSYRGLRAVVKFTAAPGAHPCGTVECARSGTVSVWNPDTPGLTNVAVWLSGVGTAAEAAPLRSFWAKTAWVPISQAGWFTDLAINGATV